MSGAEGGARRIVLALLGAEAVVAAALAFSGVVGDAGAAREADHLLVTELRLSGLALWSDASYCRHPALADLFAPHAEHPGAPEHSPAGSIVPPRAGDGAARGKRPSPRGTGRP